MSTEESIERPDSLDPLEDVLALTGARLQQASTLTGHGMWAVRFPPPAGAKFNSVIDGGCILEIEGQELHHLTAGDSFLLTRPVEFVLSSADGARLTPRSASRAFREGGGRSAVVGDPAGPTTGRLVGGAFRFDRRARALLLDSLPPVIHLSAAAPNAADVQATLTRIDTELTTRRLGSAVITEHLALVLLVEFLRGHVADAGSTGWAHGLSDPVAASMLQAIHHDPAQAWTVQSLADVAHVSRATAAARFRQSVGRTPLEYVRSWRIELAANRLTATDQSLAQIARGAGYGSETAFGLAFKRATGSAPGAYRRAARQDRPLANR
jgi:AraC-like DNA-binding protein